MKRKLLAITGYLVVLVIGIVNKDYLVDWIQTSDAGNLPIMLLISSLVASIPIIPFTLFAGIMGAKFGVMIGMAVNWFGGVTAAIIYFLLSRYLLRSFFISSLKKYNGVQKFQMMVEQNAFIAILFSRMIGVIPPAVVNVYSGVSNLSFYSFLVATSLGMLPPMFFLAYSGEQYFASLYKLSLGIVLYLIFLLFIMLVYKVWFVRKSKII